jgi:WD40 repeat protein
LADDDQRYDGFISYSRALDGTLAPTLQSALERFAKPWYRLRRLRVFRDDASLSANPGLWTSIEEALDAARFLVLLASPQAAASIWVGREVAHWRERREDGLLIVLTEGEIGWDDARGDFDWDRTTALPRAIGGAFREEPRYVDLSWARTKEHLSLRDARFREAVADVAAPLHGRPKDELIGEEIRLHRRAVRLARGAVATLVAFALAAALAAVYAFQQRDAARAQRDLAERQTRAATSRNLAAAALQNLDRNLDLGALLALASFRLDPASAEARTAAVTALQRSDHIRRVLADNEAVWEMALAPNRRVLASQISGLEIRLWDLAHGRVESFKPKGVNPVSVALGPGGLLAIGGTAGFVTVWDVRSGQGLGRFGASAIDNVLGVAFDRRGKLLASVDGSGGVALWSVRKRHLRRRLWTTMTAELPGADIAFSPDERTLAVTASDGMVTTWTLSDGRPPRKRFGVPGDGINGFAFAPHGSLLATANGSGTIRLWDYTRGVAVRKLLAAHAGGAADVAFSPDGRTLASVGEDRTVRLWHVAGWRPAKTLGAHTAPVKAVAFAGNNIVVSGGLDGDVVFWDRGGLVSAKQLSGTDGPVVRVALSPDGRILATGDGAGGVRFWDAHTSEPLSPLRPGNLSASGTKGGVVTGLAFDPTGAMLVSSREKGTIDLWDVRSRRAAAGENRLSYSEPPLGYRGGDRIAFLTGRLLASASDERFFNLWDVRRREPVPSPLLDSIDIPLVSVAASRGGIVALSDRGGQIVLWSPHWRRLAKLSGGSGRVYFNEAYALAFTPDGRTLVSGGDDDLIRFWDVPQRRPLGEPLRGHRGDVLGLAVSPDGRTLASGSADGTVRLWDVRDRRAIGEPLLVARAPVVSVAFSSDGRTLAASGPNGRVTLFDRRLWPVLPSQAARRLCAVAGRNLTPSEWAEFAPAVSRKRLCPAAGP